MPKPHGRRQKGRFAGIPIHVMESPNYCQIGAWESRLLLEFAMQYNGSNNGDLSATFSRLKNRGWKSKGTLNKALRTLELYGFIERTRMGGKHRCSLYAITWQPIDECKGKLEVRATKVASNLWQRVPQN